MNVLFVGSTNQGGQWTQMNKTAEFLRQRGIKVQVRLGCPFSLEKADLVHVFSAGGIAAARTAKRLGVPLVVSSIFWPEKHYWLALEYREFLNSLEYILLRTRHSALGKFFLDERFKGNPLSAYRYHGLVGNVRHAAEVAKGCFNLADHLLPNAEMERLEIERYLGIVKPYTIVPNAVDSRVFQQRVSSSISRFTRLPRNYLLSVSVISPRKNTLKLIRASNKLGLPLVLAGPPALSSFLGRCYYRQCRREAESQVYFLGAVPHEELWGLYARARVHALVSWYETPGLVNLEAAAMQCAIVSTLGGSTREYFGEEAEYCDPANQTSIEEAIARAWEKGPSERLKERVLSLYTWERTADLTLQAYKKVLEAKE